jgi:hypothetical protein
VHDQRAAALKEMARDEDDLLASPSGVLAYLRLADQADRNLRNDLVYETPPRSALKEKE